MPLHPFLVAIYLVLALAAANRAAGVSAAQLGAALLLALAVAGLAFLMGRLLARDRHRAGLIALVLVVAVTFFGRFRLEAGVWIPVVTRSAWAAAAVWTAAVAVPILAILHTRRAVEKATRFLNVAAAILIVFPAITLATSVVGGDAGQAEPVVPGEPHPLPVPAVPAPASRPDIYLIVLDKYSGSDPLREVYGHDNEPFEDTLRDLGFRVPDAPRANYVHTFLSLASMLNWTHLHEPTRELRGTADRQPMYDLIEDSRAVRLLRSLGYTFVFMPSSFPATAGNRYADVRIPEATDSGVRLVTAWLAGTPAAPILAWWCRRTGCREQRFPYPIEDVDRTERKLRLLSRIPDRVEGPAFVLAHFLIPHEPYLWDEDCEPLARPFWPMSDVGENEARVRKAYADQVRCTNRRVTTAVSELLARYPDPGPAAGTRATDGADSATTGTRGSTAASRRPPPIVLIQSDHGHGRMTLNPLEGTAIPLEELGPDQRRERLSVFAAYHLPGAAGGATEPYDSITPVNVLPLVFNRYLGTRIPLRPDASYWSTYQAPYRFTPVRY